MFPVGMKFYFKVANTNYLDAFLKGSSFLNLVFHVHVLPDKVGSALSKKVRYQFLMNILTACPKFHIGYKAMRGLWLGLLSIAFLLHDNLLYQ
ncbi:MAG: hypothetical protein Q4D21_03835 [Phascolarctobacterium sp.]|nr:hypothetical protein [Phascolarctobacterium sp.]